MLHPVILRFFCLQEHLQDGGGPLLHQRASPFRHPQLKYQNPRPAFFESFFSFAANDRLEFPQELFAFLGAKDQTRAQACER